MSKRPTQSSQQPAGVFVRLLDRLAGNPKRLMVALAIVCGLLAVGDLLYHKHISVSVEELPFFYPVFGFVVYAGIIFVAKGLRLIIRRQEDYYGRYAIDAETPNEHMTGQRMTGQQMTGRPR